MTFQFQPETLAAHCAFLHSGRIAFPATAGLSGLPPTPCIRVALRGGHFYDLPDTALVQPTASPLKCAVSTLKPGDSLFAPCRVAHPSVSSVTYSYEARNNKGVASRFTGVTLVTPDQAELLGWLMGGGTLHAERQAVRFSASDQAQLHRVAMLCSKAFPTIKVSWYAKSSGYDITLTSGINSPLKHFLRQMDFFEGCPMAVGRCFSQEGVLSFLRGLWGADGYLTVKRGGNEVVFGLSRTQNEYWYSFQRLLHATVGLEGSRESNKTTGSSRLMFSGYASYTKFMKMIGQVSSFNHIAVPAFRQKVVKPTVLANSVEEWYDATVLKVTRLRTPLVTYSLGTLWKNTKRMGPPLRSTLYRDAPQV